MLPEIAINLRKVEENARVLVESCSGSGIEVCGVTKAACGDPAIARAMLEGGVTQLADSRITNIGRMREAGIEAEMILLRSPGPSNVEMAVKYADVSLVSEATTVTMLDDAASAMGPCGNRNHAVILMVDIGDRREGVLPGDLQKLAEHAMALDHIVLRGIGTNLACYGGIVPTEVKMREFSSVVTGLEDATGVNIPVLSGGNSANIPMLLQGMSMGRVNHLRIGEGILLGLETVGRTPIPGTHQDAFTISAEVVESKIKPSLPDGETGQDAFGSIPKFEDRGDIAQGLLALGRQDIDIGSCVPVDPDVRILGANSDYIIADLGEGKRSVGDVITFLPGYGSLLRAMTSPYVEKVYLP